MKRATRFPWFLLKPGFAKKISDDVYRAYRAPYPSPEYEQGPAKFPVLIAVRPDNPNVPLNKAAWDKLKTFKKPFLTLFGAKDLVARGADKRMQRAIPGAAGQNHAVFPNAKHFIQEDEPELLVEHLTRFLAAKGPATE
jgi:haloalkane dehalogenase